MIKYFVEKAETGPYKYKIMANVDNIKRYVYACKFKKNAEKIAIILNDDTKCENNEKPMIYRDLNEVIDSE